MNTLIEDIKQVSTLLTYLLHSVFYKIKHCRPSAVFTKGDNSNLLPGGELRKIPLSSNLHFNDPIKWNCEICCEQFHQTQREKRNDTRSKDKKFPLRILSSK